MDNTRTKKRPVVIIIVCCFVIFVSVMAAGYNILELILTPLRIKASELMDMPFEYNPDVKKVSIIVAGNLIAVALNIVSAVAMLKQRNWGRIVFLALALTWLVYKLCTKVSFSSLCLTAVACMIYFCLLFLPSVNQYFRKEITN